MAYSSHFSTLATPQTDKARGDQVKNNAGGFVFKVDDWARLDRFLILGAEKGSYYVGERELTRDNAECVVRCVAADGPRTVARIVEISDAGRAPKNDPAIFALAICAGADDAVTRRAALAALPKVCRIGTHLLHFARDVEKFRRWGRGLRSAIGDWYNSKTADQAAYQIVKYGQRDKWSHRDLLRLAHPVTPSPAHDALYRWTVAGADAVGERVLKSKERERKYEAVHADALPSIVQAYEAARRATTADEIVRLIRDGGLTHEMLPTEWKNHAEVWEALLVDMPMTAMVRNLAKMTAVGLLKPMSAASRSVVAKLGDAAAIKKARVHPIAMLFALKTYTQGHGEKGKLMWTPVRELVDALDGAFYSAFDTIAPTGKNTMLALDVSGSMAGGYVAGGPLTPREGSAAMAMVTARSEPTWFCMGFSNRFVPLAISPRQRLDDVATTISNLPFDSTDCGLPMRWALQNKVEVDVFHVYTDNETFAGPVHPFQALREYRQKMGRAAKLVVVGMTATEFTIADPDDAGMLDVVGFDSAAPSIIADFARQALTSASA